MRAALVALVLGLTACSTPVGDFALLSRAAPTGMRVVRANVEGRSCRTAWLPGMYPRAEAALADALAQAGGGDALANVTVTREHQWLVIVERFCFRVRGDAVELAR